MTEPYAQMKSELTITPDEIDSGEYEPEHVEAFQSMAKQAVATEADAVSAFSEALVDQNPEFLEVMEQTGRTPEEFSCPQLVTRRFRVGEGKWIVSGNGSEALAVQPLAAWKAASLPAGRSRTIQAPVSRGSA